MDKANASRLRANRSKASNQVTQAKKGRTRSGAALADVIAGNRSRGPKLTTKKFKGEWPPFNDGREIYDPDTNRVYLVGGKRPGDPIASSDFYCCDIEDDGEVLTWRNLSDSLRFRIPEEPWSETELTIVNKRLPRLAHPGVTRFRMHNKNFILMFGGYDEDAHGVSSRLVMINLANLAWSYVKIGGGNVLPRVSPAIVAIGHKVFIFGGYRMENDLQPHFSYSIASINPAGNEGWYWDDRDVEYSPIARGKIFGQATSVYGGMKIVLTPGQKKSGERLHFTDENIFSFHTATKKFLPQDIIGNFPRDVCWYECFEDPFSSGEPPSSSLSTVKLPSRSVSIQAGSTSSTRQHSASRINITPAASESSSTAVSGTSILIAACVAWEDSEFEATQELWRLSLTPMHWKLECLDIGARVYDLDQDLKCVVLTGNQLLLLGYEPESEANPDQLVCMNPDDPEDTEDKRGIFNIFVNVPIPHP